MLTWQDPRRENRATSFFYSWKYNFTLACAWLLHSLSNLRWTWFSFASRYFFWQISNFVSVLSEWWCICFADVIHKHIFPQTIWPIFKHGLAEWWWISFADMIHKTNISTSYLVFSIHGMCLSLFMLFLVSVVIEFWNGSLI